MLKLTAVTVAIAGLMVGLASAPATAKPVNLIVLGAEINQKLDKTKDGQLNGYDWAKMSKPERAANAKLISTYFWAKYKEFKKKPLEVTGKEDQKIITAQAAKIQKRLDADYLMPYTRKTALFDNAIRAFTENHTKYNK
jgi:hypothetical protein